MPPPRRRHPVILTVAILAILGGLLTTGRSLFLLQAALEQHQWPAATLHKTADHPPSYRVGEQEFVIPAEFSSQLTADNTLVFYNPEAPQHIVAERSNFWWPLYLSMAGLIVFYAGLHLLREKNRNLQSLGFE